MIVSVSLVAGVFSMLSFANAAGGCLAVDPVCSVRASVFHVSSFDPVGSAVRIGPNLLVTNRHVVADEETVRITLRDGTFLSGRVVPTAYRGDLILIRAKLPKGVPVTLGKVLRGNIVHTVGYDLNLRRVKASAPGKLIAPLAKLPFSRIHHTAYTQPGNSGGALVNPLGEVVGIVAAGGAGRFDAVPARAIAELKAKSGAEFAVASKALGLAYRNCQLALEKRGPEVLTTIVEICARSGNRQFLDLAAQRAGVAGKIDLSIALSKKALERDPDSVNSIVSLVETLRFARRAKEALPYARRLVELLPTDDRIQAMAVMIGRVGEDDALVQKAVGLVKKYHPKRWPFIERMLKQPIRR